MTRQTAHQPAEVAARGRRLYEVSIHDKVAQGNEGKFLALDVDTGEYEIDADALADGREVCIDPLPASPDRA